MESFKSKSVREPHPDGTASQSGADGCHRPIYPLSECLYPRQDVQVRYPVEVQGGAVYQAKVVKDGQVLGEFGNIPRVVLEAGRWVGECTLEIADERRVVFPPKAPPLRR